MEVRWKVPKGMNPREFIIMEDKKKVIKDSWIFMHIDCIDMLEKSPNAESSTGIYAHRIIDWESVRKESETFYLNRIVYSEFVGYGIWNTVVEIQIPDISYIREKVLNPKYIVWLEMDK